MTDSDGIPLAVEHTAANVHDSQIAVALLDSIPAIRQARGRPRLRPDAVLADAAYDAEAKIRRPLRRRSIQPVIRRRSDPHGSGLGELRYVVEACFDWLFSWRRLRVRYEKRADIHDAFLSIACAMICWKKLSAKLPF